MPRYLDPKSDIVFKKVFGQHPLLLKSFLNALLPLPQDSVIESLEYLNPENVPEIPVMKRTIVDVRCTDQKGRHFIVEMQIEWVTAFMQRVLFNTSSAYVKQLRKGNNYDVLNPVYGLALLGHNFRPEDPHWIHHYQMTHQRSSEPLGDMHLVFVEFPKFKPDTLNDKRLMVLWLRFMSEINDRTDTIDPELFKVPEIKEAIELTQTSAYSRTELDAYDAYWDSVSTDVTLMEGKFKLGLQQGIQQGLQEGERNTKIIMAKKLTELGVSKEKILEATGLDLHDF